MGTVLVTGGTGLLGGRVARELAASGHTVNPVPGSFSEMRRGPTLAEGGNRAGGLTWSDFLSTHLEWSQSDQRPTQG